MDYKYPHWYNEGMECCEEMGKEMCCDNPMTSKVIAFQNASFKDRLLTLLGDEVLFSVDARICRRESFCGTLCYVGCDFVIVNVCLRHQSVSMHIPINMIRFIAPFKGRVF